MSTDLVDLITEHTDSLRRYLPAQLADPFTDQPTMAGARQCDAHLDALLHAVSTYLPRYLVRESLQDPVPGQVSGQFRQATIMFADISGFTAMSERLSRKGEQGAEMITNIVGAYFTTMLEVTGQHGGDLLKFGGDALLVAFLEEDHAIQACRAAAEMQRAIAQFSQVEAFGETFRLKMTVGLGSGPLFTANLGTVQKMEYTVMGEALTHMAHAEDQAEGGEIFCDQATYDAVRDRVEIDDERNHCYRIRHVEGDGETTDPTRSLDEIIHPTGQEDLVENADLLASHLAENVVRLDTLSPFLPPGLLDLLRFEPLGTASRARGEFRPVTVIFANFYGIDEIIDALGPSRAAETTAILNAHFSRMQAIINRYEGVIDKVDSYVVGHRIMALFGAPRAHVDDPERAVRAAWEMQSAMDAFAELETSAGTFTLQQRIGINTGRVFAGNVGSSTRHEYSVMGDEVNLTARLMSAAQEDQILISQSTTDEVGAHFRLDEQTPVRVKGKSKPVPNYHVRGVRQGLRAAGSGRRTPLVGRDDEWQQIWSLAEASLEGASHVLALYGEMGMGKSRVIEELVDVWGQHGGTAYAGACLSYGRHTPYAPWVGLLRQVLGISPEDDEEWSANRIQETLDRCCSEWSEWAALLGQMLGVSMQESDLLRALDPQLRQQNLQRLVTDLLVAQTGAGPTLLILDDIQWIDEVSLALLNHLVTHLPESPILICAAYRPEEPVALACTESTCYHELRLDPLSQAGSLALLDSQLPTAPEMPQRLKSVILKNAQGNPLFIVEMAHALIENYLVYDAENDVFLPRTDLDRVQVPDSVSRVILSRLDRLDEQSRNLLNTASVIGRTFQQWLLRAIAAARADDTAVEAQLLDMCEKDLLDRGELFYLFRHVMTREVAYESLLYADRRELHKRIALSIEDQQSTRLDEYVEVLAEHYTLAESWPEALRYQLQAGNRAQAVYANEDAIHRYQSAIEVAGNLPPVARARSARDEIAAHEGLGDTYQIVGRYDEALKSYAQAVEALDDDPAQQPHRADLFRKMARVHESQGAYDQALEWVDRGLELVQEESIERARLHLRGAGVLLRMGRFQDTIQWSQQALDTVEADGSEAAQQATAHAYHLLGYANQNLGTSDKAILYYEASLDTYRALEDSRHVARAQNNLANLYFYQDDWVQASEYYGQALATLERIGDLFGQAVIGNNLGGILDNQGQLEEARARYQRSLDLAQELGIWGLAALLHNNLGHTYLHERAWGQAKGELEESLAIFHRIGLEEYLSELYRNLAEMYLGLGQVEEGLSWAKRSLSRSIETENRLEEGRTRRVLGECYRAIDQEDEARAEYEQSLQILRKLGSAYQTAQTSLALANLYEGMGEEQEAGRLRQEAGETLKRLNVGRLDH